MIKAINLIPKPILDARARRRRLRAWIAADALLGAVAVGALILASPPGPRRAERLRADFETVRSALADEQERLARTSAALRQARADEAVARRIGARPDFSGLLLTLAENLDDRSFLEQVIVAPQVFEPGTPATGAPPAQDAARAPRERYQLLVSGVALTMGDVSRFALELDHTGYFSRVWLASTTPREVGTVRGVEFKIIATLGEGRLAEAPADTPPEGTP